MAFVKSPSRRKVEFFETYKGYPIVKVTITYYQKLSRYDTLYCTNLIERRDEYLGIVVKGGNYKKKSDRFKGLYSFKDRKKYVWGLIDEIENGNRILLTESEYEKWVEKPNDRCGWGFSYNSILALMREFKKADARRKVGYIERLTDANFHQEAAALEEEDYDKFMKLIDFLPR